MKLLNFDKPYLKLFSLIIVTCLITACSDDSADMTTATTKLTKVIAKNSIAKSKTQYLKLFGTVKTDKYVDVKSDIEGKIIEIKKGIGHEVKHGEILATLASTDFSNLYESARNYLRKKQKILQSLKRTNAPAEKINAAVRAVAKATAQFNNTKKYSNLITIRAPLTGYIEQKQLEEGSNIRPGDKLFTIIDDDELIVTCEVPEKYINTIKLEAKAAIQLINDNKYGAVVNFIARDATPKTNSFSIKAKINNVDHKIKSGMSAEVIIATAHHLAHKIARSTLVITSSGNIGIHAINKNNVVEFYPVKILEDNDKELWVYNLPTALKIITRGQGFVRKGEKVILEVS